MLFFNKLVGISIFSYVTGLNEDRFYSSFIWNLILTMLWWSLYLSSISGIVRSFVSIFVVSICLALLRKYLFITRNSCFLRYYFIVSAVYHLVKKSTFVKRKVLYCFQNIWLSIISAMLNYSKSLHVQSLIFCSSCNLDLR